MRLVLTILAAFMLAAPASAQVEGGPDNRFVWREAWGGQEVHLFYYSRLVGGWDVTNQCYRKYDGHNWSPRATESPCQVPAQYVQPADNFGVMTEKLYHGAPRYTISENGRTREVPRDEALSAVEKGVPDYGNRYYLIVIGSDAERKKVTDDWSSIPALAPLREKTLLWSVAPDHWSLKDNKTGQPLYVTTGHPTIYFQAPRDQAGRGKVLHRQDDYAGPIDFAFIAGLTDVKIPYTAALWRPRQEDAKQLAPRWDGPPVAPVEEKRENGGYDPAKDPDARKGILPSLQLGDKAKGALAAGGGAMGLAYMALWLLARRKKK